MSGNKREGIEREKGGIEEEIGQVGFERRTHGIEGME